LRPVCARGGGGGRHTPGRGIVSSVGDMDMTTALARLGVTAESIDDETRERLDRDGYAPLTGILTGHQLTVMRARLAELLAAEGERAGLEVHQEAGADRLADLVNKDPVFEVCFTDPRLLACVAHVLGEFKLSSLNFRAALPGHGLQALHAEGRPVTDPADYRGNRRGLQQPPVARRHGEPLARAAPCAALLLHQARQLPAA
jgi:hypothetical protein